MKTQNTIIVLMLLLSSSNVFCMDIIKRVFLSNRDEQFIQADIDKTLDNATLSDYDWNTKLYNLHRELYSAYTKKK